MDYAMKLSISTQHPRVYEIIAKIMKETTTATKELVNLHATNNKDLVPVTPNQSSNKTTGTIGDDDDNTVVFSGTPEALQRMLLNGKKNAETAETERDIKDVEGEVLEHDE